MPTGAIPIRREKTILIPPWRVDVLRGRHIASPVSQVAVARAVARALEKAGAPEPGSVTVLLTNDDELRALNFKHLGNDDTTDVLSFPMVEPEAFRQKGPDDARSTRRTNRTLLKNRPQVHIGDIAISVERAIEQAERGRGGHTGDVRWSPADELRLLVTHGTLHLCGWDHAEPGEEAAMRALERELLAAGR